MTKSLRIEGSKDFDPRYHNEAAQKWIEALESGEYEQGYRRLCSGGYYCCLGVGHVVVAGSNPSIDSHLLSADVTDALGLRSYAGAYVQPNNATVTSRYLFKLNDEKKKTFPEIAAILRNDPQNYFREIDNG